MTDFESKQPNPDLPEVMDISADELRGKKDGVCLVDVRQPDEFRGELGHIPGARLIPLNTLADRIKDIPNDQTVVFICRSGGRSGRATAFALESGLQDVYNLKGGMLGWNQLHFEIEK